MKNKIVRLKATAQATIKMLFKSRSMKLRGIPKTFAKPDS
jgi:hypothetical protein